MRVIKIPPQEFALKMQGELMREGGRICGTLRYLLAVVVAGIIELPYRTYRTWSHDNLKHDLLNRLHPSLSLYKAYKVCDFTFYYFVNTHNVTAKIVAQQ